MNKQPPMGSNRPDDFQTPPWPLDYLMPYANILLKPRNIWECAAGHGLLVNSLKERGYNVISTDILTGQDFLTYRQDWESYDMIITNPPYSIKDAFLERAYSLHKPFAFLLPLTALEGKRRQYLYAAWGLQVIFLPRRVNFVTPSGQGTGSWFATAWFTHGLNLKSDLIFTS